MNIANVTVRLTENDIFSIIKDYIKIDEIKIENICIGEEIEIEGKLIKGLSFNFKVNVIVHSIENNVLKLKISSVKLGRISIAVGLVSFIIKRVLKSLEIMGITVDKKFLHIDFTKLCNYIPSVSFTLQHITSFKGSLDVELKNLVYSEGKQALSLKELQEHIDEVAGSKEICCNTLTKTRDKYTEVREDIKESIPEKSRYISEYFLILPDIIALLYRLMKDNRVSTKTKILIGGVVGYLITPTDIIPDFIPIVGKGEDFGIAFLVLDKIIEEVPKDIILEHWQGDNEVICKIMNINNDLMEVVGRNNAVRIFSGAIIFLKKRKRRQRF